MGTLSAEASEARRNYQREYISRNRERVNQQRRNWCAENRDKVQRYNREYWERKAEKAKNIRASWADYGISEERRRELQDIAKSDEYAGVVLDCALRADRKAAGHIILSVIEGLFYEHVEFHEGLGRCSLGKSDFYGARRLFFHYLDMALQKNQQIQGDEVNG